MFLNPEEIIDLTHKRNRTAQVKALRRMGIEHKVRPNGTVAISRSHIEKVFGGNASSAMILKKEIEPNWSALNGKKA